MARQYGDVYSLKIINSSAIILSSTAAIREIMDKNSAVVSDRPASHFAQEITGGNHMGASRYSEFLPLAESREIPTLVFRRPMAPSQTMCTRSFDTICVQKSPRYSTRRGHTTDV